MILKEKTFAASDDKFQQAGDKAEREMAFYLKRYFSDSPDYLILHDLRLVLDDDVAQIDHLVIHPAGITTIETKSVAGKIQMKEDGQWIRWYGNNQSKGMPSPLIQAQLQLELLKRVLRRSMKNPTQLDLVPFDSLIAISTQGIFIPPKQNAPTNVFKTDLVAEQLLKRGQAPRLWQHAMMQTLAQFLVRSHQPKETEVSADAAFAAMPDNAEPAPPSDVAQASPQEITHLSYIGDRLKPAGTLRNLMGAGKFRKVYATFCKKCQSQELEFRYGPHGYYLKCLKCNGNTAIKLDCRQCGRQTKLRKQEHYLFVECSHCQLSEVVHRNDQPLPELP